MTQEVIYTFPFQTILPADEVRFRRGESSIVQLKDGDCLIAVTNHAGRGDNSSGYIGGQRLNAQGEPQGEEWLIIPSPKDGLNVMSPALRRLPDGRLGMVYSCRMSTKAASRQFSASSDEGLTWSEPVAITYDAYMTGCHDRLTVTRSGALLAPLHCTDDWDKHYLHVRVARSADNGVSWNLSGKLELPQVLWPGSSRHIESGCVEPGIAERADGSLLMTIRTAMGTQYCSESFDDGMTWTEPRSMEVISPQAPAHLSRVPDTDDLLLVWTPNADGKRHTILCCVSSDGGRSWPHARRKLLVQDSGHRVDYPAVFYRENEAWITLRKADAQGVTSTGLMRVPLQWLYE